MISEKENQFPQLNKGIQDLNIKVDQMSGEIKSMSEKNMNLFQSKTSNIFTPEAKPTKIKSVQTEVRPEFLVSTKPFCEYKEEYLTEEHANKITEFLNKAEFVTEGQRSVLFFGEKYRYMGSDKTPTPLPDVLKPLLEKLNKESKHGELNQCLVNKYVGKNSSIPRHSDSELSIDPHSNIYCVSLGETAHIKFEKKSNDASDEKMLSVTHRSMYSMSKNSQNHFSHKIEPNSELPDESVRYSITFRRVHWQYLNSTYATGDSNFGRIHFGEGKGKMGAATPGLRDWAPHVTDINPQKTLGYKNVVVMSGTNDLKIEMDDEEVEILNVYKKYKAKFEEIRKINPSCRLFVCPVLPTRDTSIKNRVRKFNKLIHNDLMKAGLKICFVEGFSSFVDFSSGLLKESLFDKRSETDVLHINDAGYCILVSCIKRAIRSSKELKVQGRQAGQRSYSNVVSSGLHRPVTG